MATKFSNFRGAVSSGDYGNASTYTDSVLALPADVEVANDLRLVYVPAGTLVDKVVFNSPVAGPTVNIGLVNKNGIGTPLANASAFSVAAPVALPAGNTAIEVFPPFEAVVDSWLQLTVTAAPAVAFAAAGVVISAKVCGSYLGVK